MYLRLFSFHYANRLTTSLGEGILDSREGHPSLSTVAYRMSNRWKFSVKALSPDGNGTIDVGLPFGLVKALQRDGPGPRYSRMALVKEVCESPISIRRGWEREGYDDALIYIGQPGKDLRSNTIEVPPPPDMLFFVFVAPDGTIEEWNWRRCSQEEAIANEKGLGLGELIWAKATQS